MTATITLEALKTAVACVPVAMPGLRTLSLVTTAATAPPTGEIEHDAVDHPERGALDQRLSCQVVHVLDGISGALVAQATSLGGA